MDTGPTRSLPQSGATDLLDLTGFGRVVVLTGAGISAPSGIPTYRTRGSGWDNADLERKSQASRVGNHLPELWQFWGALRAATAAASPNPAHLALAAWQNRLEATAGSLLVVTQNVDGLHQRAGSREVAELHGSIHRSRCYRCRETFDDSQVPTAGQVPLHDCVRHGRLRPDMVLFGEPLSARTVRRVQGALRAADLCVYVGTSGTVWPAADLVSTARKAGAFCVLVNADPWDTPHPAFHATVLGDAATLLPAMLHA